ncbi:MAG: efflux RND transporter periplasmic adaptor subunit [Planctomycetes bacterium]|nr:efflux RND transporter periplasmic adaptor subunit [Planctomycetota bacterium]
MSTEFTAQRPQGSRFGSLALLLIAAAGGAYAGMRWHTTLERWLVPSMASAQPEPVNSVSAEKKQLWTCGMHPQVIQDHPGDCPICHMKLTPLVSGGESTAPADAATVIVDPAIVQNMGVRTAEVTEAPLRQKVRVYAMITEAEPGHRDVNLRVSGWIQTLYANTDGMTVKTGDPLFDLYSPELNLAIEELISARRAAKAAENDAGSSLRDTSASLVAAAENRLLALDLTPEQISELGAMEHAPSVVTFRSPFDGHVTEKAGVYAGTSVVAGQRVFRLAQRTTMWVEGRVPEADLGRVRVGQKTSARVDAYPGRAFDGEVIFIHPHFDEMTRTAMVRMALSNHDYALHEGMYATLEIDVGDAEPAVLAPREAVIDTGESQVVFVSAGKGRFEPRRVIMGQSGERGMVQILTGLKPGEQVVASGQFLLDSESRLREAIAKFLGQKAMPVAGETVEPIARPTMPQVTAAPATPPDHSAAHATPATPAPSATPPPPTAVSASSEAAKVDAIIAAYLPLAESLGAVQKSNTPLQVDALIVALHAMHADVTAPEKLRLITKAAKAAEAMKGQSIDNQRELFKSVSARLIELVDAMPPSSSVAGSLYVLNCPMAKADWLQRTKDIANPYYAEEMKECGAVVRPVAGAKGGE